MTRRPAEVSEPSRYYLLAIVSKTSALTNRIATWALIATSTYTLLILAIQKVVHLNAKPATQLRLEQSLTLRGGQFCDMVLPGFTSMQVTSSYSLAVIVQTGKRFGDGRETAARE